LVIELSGTTLLSWSMLVGGFHERVASIVFSIPFILLSPSYAHRSLNLRCFSLL
jgi:hypothetical protein